MVKDEEIEMIEQPEVPEDIDITTMTMQEKLSYVKENEDGTLTHMLLKNRRTK